MKGVFGLSYQPNETWRAELVMTAVRRKTRIDDSLRGSEDFRYFATPGFVTLDLLGEYRFGKRARVNLGVFNLTDKNTGFGAMLSPWAASGRAARPAPCFMTTSTASAARN